MCIIILMNMLDVSMTVFEQISKGTGTPDNVTATTKSRMRCHFFMNMIIASKHVHLNKLKTGEKGKHSYWFYFLDHLHEKRL